MKTLKVSGIFLIALAIVFPTFAFGAQQGQAQQQSQQGVHTPGTGLQNSQTGQRADSSQEGAISENSENQEQNQNQVRDTEGEDEGQGEVRRSQVANAVQEMLQVAERNQGIGQQIREVARVQNEVQERAENALKEVKERKTWLKLLIGPNYGRLKQVEGEIESLEGNVKELVDLKNQVKNQGDQTLLQEQIETLEQVGQELKQELSEAQEQVSMFGWLNRLFSRFFE